ncbi:MAG: adenylate/guanylate cyclase domain-containing protein [Rhodospirillaceae bacterium]|nr:adenylate/guanylate cyclase domain-containing protein [Rhodospirillaceae bacterium]
MDPLIAEHGGRIANTAGDSLLLEFPSAVDAVRCTVAIQTEMLKRNSTAESDRQIAFRVGINVGDVVVDGEDLLGDCVNIAARLESLATPGGMGVSDDTYRQVRDRLEIEWQDGGAYRVKNIDRPLQLWHWSPDGSPPPAAAEKEAPDRAGMTFIMPDKPSIAVLPFDNLTGDPAQDYIGDGLTENIIAVLSTSPDLVVIARNSVFTYKGKAIHVQDVAAQLGVYYVLEGSVQRAGKMLRITAQLIDAEGGNHLWADRYDRELENLFELQDEIAQQIRVELDIKLTIGGDARHLWEGTRDLETYRQIVIARGHFQSFSPEGHREAERLLNEVYRKQPDIAVSNQWMAWLHWQKIVLRLTDDHKKSIATARDFIERQRVFSIEAGTEPRIHNLLAILDMYERKHDDALIRSEIALQHAGNDGAGIALMGFVKLFSGQPEEGLRLCLLAIQNEPDYPQWIMKSLIPGFLLLERYREAKEAAEGVLASPIEDAMATVVALRSLTIMARFDGDQKAAERYCERLRSAAPLLTVGGVRYQCNYWKDLVHLERCCDALRQAGLPE